MSHPVTSTNIDSESPTPRLVKWYGYAVFYLGVLCFPGGIVFGTAGYFMEGWDVWTIASSILEFWSGGVAICGFGLGVATGIKDFLIGLLIIVAFGSGLIGFLFILGRNPEIGYYLWTAGGVMSSSLIIILIAYWKKLPVIPQVSR